MLIEIIKFISIHVKCVDTIACFLLAQTTEEAALQRGTEGAEEPHQSPVSHHLPTEQF